MDVNGDFGKRVMLHGDAIAWESSPMPGVDRRRLDRVDGDMDRVTTIVRYAPGSHFSPHVHSGGEEFIVIEGVFEDDYGDWPVGSYVRNPPQSKHRPGSEPGCTIFVKLCQFDPHDRTYIHANIDKIDSVAEQGRPGVRVSPLFRDARENVRIEYWAANAQVQLDSAGGAEIFVLDGGFAEAGDQLRRHSWLRLPVAGRIEAVAGPDGAKLWIKTGHLKDL